jgi:hypothetical protein
MRICGLVLAHHPGMTRKITSTVIASEAKQSSFASPAKRKLDCFVASLLAMTAENSRRQPTK